MQREHYGTVKKQVINYDLERGYQGKLGGKVALGRDLDMCNSSITSLLFSLFYLSDHNLIFSCFYGSPILNTSVVPSKYSEHKQTCLTMSQITPDITPASVRPELPCHLIVYILLTWTFFEAHTPYLFSEHGKEIPRASCMDLGKCLEMLGKDQGKEAP